jgi:protein tyrosine phosphatase
VDAVGGVNESHLSFERLATKNKTAVEAVVSVRTGEEIGLVKWYSPWRRFAFFPNEKTVWDAGCLKEVSEEIAYLERVRARDRGQYA